MTMAHLLSLHKTLGPFVKWSSNIVYSKNKKKTFYLHSMEEFWWISMESFGLWSVKFISLTQYGGAVLYEPSALMIHLCLSFRGCGL